MRRVALFAVVPILSFCALQARGAEGRRLPATATAERSAEGHGPALAVDGNESTLWIANLKVAPENNRTWFQLDLGGVKQVAHLHWQAAQGQPYPASAPSTYRVLLSDDAKTWVPAGPAGEGGIEPVGDVLLNGDARYVRLETTKINDGSGWSLGLREIWVTEGRDNSAAAARFRPRLTAQDGKVRLTWSAPEGSKPAQYRLFRTEAPRGKAGAALATVPGTTTDYTDAIPNWSPRYYHLEALDSAGKVLATSAIAAGIARPQGADAAPIETFAFWYEPYKPSTDASPSLKHIGNAPIVIGPGFQAAADLAKNGRGLLPYVTYYQTAGWVGSGTFPQTADPKEVAAKIAPVCFYRKSVSFVGCPPGYVPTVFCRPGNVEYRANAVQYTTCPNSAPFRDLVLAHTRKQLDGGVAGFFVDNGYEDDVAARAQCESTEHAHYYGEELTAADAFLGMLLDVTCEVKKRHPNGVVMVNGGVPAKSSYYGLTLGDVCDGQLWESFLRSSYSTEKEHVYAWQGVYNRAVDLEKAWNGVPSRKMFVLSYPWNREEAYFCYATAKLCNLPWSASLGISDPQHKEFGGHFGTYPELVDLRLGSPTDAKAYGGMKLGSAYFREFAKGMVVVNPDKTERRVVIDLQGKLRKYRDVFAGKDGEGATISLTLPAESGRVLLWK